MASSTNNAGKVLAIIQYSVDGLYICVMWSLGCKMPDDLEEIDDIGWVMKFTIVRIGDGTKNPRELLTDTDLLSFEKLDRASPDLWPEQIPGVAEFAAEKKLEAKSSDPPKWLADLENDDINLLQEFGSLTTSQLIEKVRGLQNLAYQLGLDEAREMTRGKFLNILQRQNKRQ